VLNTTIQFTQAEILEEAEQHPERFSPNVVLRPLFQEMILPNLAYVGGGGELAYWLERKSLFQYFHLPMPMLVRRHSILWMDRDVLKKLQKTGFSASEFFADTDALIRSFVERNAAAEVSLEPQIQTLRGLYQQLAEKAKAIDPTLESSLMAESVKAISGLEQWQSRLVRAEKQKHETALQQIRSLKEKLFPAGGLQERHDNVLPYLLKYGDDFADTILQHLEPFDPGFVILEEEPAA
jgi:bacillithiol biosynthesis cysteine-adding enzyme BshC